MTITLDDRQAAALRRLVEGVIGRQRETEHLRERLDDAGRSTIHLAQGHTSDLLGVLRDLPDRGDLMILSTVRDALIRRRS